MTSNMTRRKRKTKKQRSDADTSHQSKHSSRGSSGYLNINNSRSSFQSSSFRGYKRYRGDKRPEEPFLITNLKVGGVLAIAIFTIYILYNAGTGSNLTDILPNNSYGTGAKGPGKESGADGDVDGLWSEYVQEGNNDNEGENLKTKVFPSFELGKDSNYDAWGMFQQFFPEYHNHNNRDGAGGSEKNPKRRPQKYDEFFQSASEIRDDFALRWGGENSARALLASGLTTFAPNLANTTSSGHGTESNGDGDGTNDNGDVIPFGIRQTANRILKALKSKEAFQISFAGSSAVSGRGNQFHQAFPSIVASTLMEPFKQIGIELEVRNAAVAGIGSFPYGWCLSNFLGDGVDVMSWDPEMTSGGDTMVAFEGYLRNSIGGGWRRRGKKSSDIGPMMVVREYVYTEPRRELLQKYVDYGAIVDPIVINLEAAIAQFQDLDETILPLAMQKEEWSAFGGPPGAPGKTRTNLSLQQHRLVGELLSLHLLAAAELALAHVSKKIPGSQGDFLDISVGADSAKSKHTYMLPPPQSSDAMEDSVSTQNSMIFGSPVPVQTDERWYMNNIHCRTSFDPIIHGALNDTILSGSDAEDIDLLLPKGPMLYNQNWILDYGPMAKKMASSVASYDLGYQDRRKGYFGVKPSGKLSMFLPYELDETGPITKYKQLQGKKPNEVYKSVVVCEVNERADCKMDSDMKYVLGGKSTEAKIVQANGVSYNRKKLCVSMDIPEEAEWTTRKKATEKVGLLRRKSAVEEMGLVLDMAVSNELLFWKDGPCSISHLIWEQRSKI